MAMIVGTEFIFPRGAESETTVWREISGGRDLSGVRAKVMVVNDDSSSRPYGVHLYYDGEFRPNTRGEDECFWYGDEHLENIEILPPRAVRSLDEVMVYDGRSRPYGVRLDEVREIPYEASMGEPSITASSFEHGNHIILIPIGGGYLHKDGIIRNMTRVGDYPNPEWRGYYQNLSECNDAIQLFELNSRFRGTPHITHHEIDEDRQFYVGFEGDNLHYLHNNGEAKYQANDDDSGTMAWYRTREDAQLIVDTYMMKKMNFDARSYAISVGNGMWADRLGYTVLGVDEAKDIPTNNDYYISFTAEQLENFNITNPLQILLNIEAESEDAVKERLREYFGEGRVHYAIYEGYTARSLLVTEMGYETYSYHYIKTLKRPDVPENYTKELYIEYDLANNLCKIDDKFNGIFCSGNDISICYKVKSTNAYNTVGDKRVKQGGHKVTSNKQELRLGRVVKAFAGHIFTDLDIEGIVSKFKTNYEIDTSVVKLSDDVSGVYGMGSVGGSCMSSNPSETFDIYEDMKTKIAYIEDSSGGLMARALVHEVVDREGNEYTVLDRIFYDDEKSKLTLKQWRKEQDGMTRMSLHSDKYFRGKYEISSSYDQVPYIDNLCYAQYIDGDLYLCNTEDWGSNYDHLQETNGGSCRGEISHGGEDMVWCVDTDDSCHIDDAYYCDGDGNYYRYSDDLVYVNHSYYHTDDDRIAYDENTNEWAWRDDLKHCESEDCYTSSEDYVYIEMGEYEGSYEPLDETTYCEDICGNVMSDEATFIEDEGHYVYHEDEYFEHENGKWYSYEEEIEEDEEPEEVA